MCLRSPKPQYLRRFFASGSKHHRIYSVFVPVPSKNTGIYTVFSMLQDVVSICEKDKNIVFYDVFASRAQQKIVKQWLKNAQNRLPKACQTCASADTFRAAQTLDSPA